MRYHKLSICKSHIYNIIYIHISLEVATVGQDDVFWHALSTKIGSNGKQIRTRCISPNMRMRLMYRTARLGSWAWRIFQEHAQQKIFTKPVSLANACAKTTFMRIRKPLPYQHIKYRIPKVFNISVCCIALCWRLDLHWTQRCWVKLVLPSSLWSVMRSFVRTSRRQQHFIRVPTPWTFRLIYKLARDSWILGGNGGTSFWKCFGVQVESLLSATMMTE